MLGLKLEAQEMMRPRGGSGGAYTHSTVWIQPGVTFTIICYGGGGGGGGGCAPSQEEQDWMRDRRASEVSMAGENYSL